MLIKEVYDKKEKIEVSKGILNSLPNWFGIPEAIEEYTDESSRLPFFIAVEESKVVGFISIKENSKYTAEVYLMGVLSDYHKRGIGRELINKVLKWSKNQGYEFLQVKTLDESHQDIYYEGTRKFYKSVGFKEFECLKELWGEENPCLIMLQHIG